MNGNQPTLDFPDRPNPGPTVLVSNDLPSPCDGLYRPTSFIIPCLVSANGTNLKAVVTEYSIKPASSNSPYSQCPPYLRISTSCPDSSPQKLTGAFESKPTDVSDTPIPLETAAKDVNPRLRLRRSPLIELEEIHSRSPVQLHRKPAHPTFQTLAPKARRADGITTRVIAILPVPFPAGNLSRLVYTLPQTSSSTSSSFCITTDRHQN